MKKEIIETLFNKIISNCKEALNSISYSYAQTGYFDYARLTKMFEKGEISTL